MTRRLAALFVATLMAGPAGLMAAQTPVAASAEAAALRELALAIPLGSRVKVETKEGRRLTATLMRATADELLLKRATRVPEPAVSVPLADVVSLERDRSGGGMSIGKAIGVGLAAGAGAVAALIAFAVAVSN
jgi:hypothetical protein